MSKDNGTALSVGQFAELAAALTRAAPRNIEPERADYWARHGKELAEILLAGMGPQRPDTPFVPEEWVRLDVGGQSSVELEALLAEHDVSRVSYVDKDVDNRALSLSPKRQRNVSFARTTPAELGFAREPFTLDLIPRIEAVGGSLCRPDDVFSIAMALAKGEITTQRHSVIVLSKPVEDRLVWSIDRMTNGKWMIGPQSVHPTKTWYLKNVYDIVFRI